MSQRLNYKLEGDGETIVLIHGLFGNLDNLGLLARELKNHYQVVSIDLRNHGLSFHSSQHSYQLMAQDVVALLQHLSILSPIIIGHSMGGKVAMKMIEQLNSQIRALIVLDMAPVSYTTRRHDAVFAGLQAVLMNKPSSRNQALEILAQHINEDSVRLFLSKSLMRKEDTFCWRFNVNALVDNYSAILGWDPIAQNHVPTLFIKGGNSEYITAEYQSNIQQQFAQAKAHIIANTGHWLHAEKPNEVLRVINKFLN
jgi:esterase